MFLSRIRRIIVALVDYVIHGTFASGMNLRDVMLEKKSILEVEGENIKNFQNFLFPRKIFKKFLF